MWNWVPQPHDARLFLLKAREHDALLESGPELACVPLAGAGIEILPVASNHSTLLSFPHVKAVAPEILRRLFLAPRPRAVGGNSDALRLEPVELERTS
jgi:thioesterase domain-containing protein